MISIQIIFRILLKILQLICSAFLIYCLYNIGSQWILALICLVVPPFNIYLTLRSQNQKNRCDRYYREIEKSWLRVEIAICLTMAIVFFGFGILLFCGFFKLMGTFYFLLAGLSSIFAALLYMTNGLIIIGFLRQNIMDITVNKEEPKKIYCITKDDPNHFSISVINEQQKAIHDNAVTMVRVEKIKEQPALSIDNTSTILIKSQDVLFSADQQSEVNQHIIDYIREELDQDLDNQGNSYDSSCIAYGIGHCINKSNSVSDVPTIVSSGEGYQYASGKYGNISESNTCHSQ